MIYFSNPYQQYLAQSKDIKNAINSFLKRGSYILGEEVKNFENDFSKYCDSKYGIGVNSGTDAIFLALKAINIQYGDEVITTSHTAIASVSAIISSGATPVLVDINSHTLNMDYNKINEAITKNTKAILAVHMYGNPVEIDQISRIAKKNKVFLIEDCAQATGALYKDKKVGSYGVMGCFSFYPTKNLGSLGDGGMIVTSNIKLANKIRRIRQYGWDDKRLIKYIGINSRLDEFHATVLKTKLKNLDKDNNLRNKIADFYSRNLDLNKFKIPVKNNYSKHVYHLYVIQTNNRNQILKSLFKKNIFAGVHYRKAVHQEKVYLSKCKVSKSGLKNTDEVVKKIISLPIYPQLKIKDVKYICDVMNSIDF